MTNLLPTYDSPLSTPQEVSDIAIRVSNLSKCYHIYDKPQDRLKQSIYPRLQRLIGKPSKICHREFWALKDASFEVKKGEARAQYGKALAADMSKFFTEHYCAGFSAANLKNYRQLYQTYSDKAVPIKSSSYLAGSASPTGLPI